MPIDREIARRALRSSRGSFPHVNEEYLSFLASLREMKKHLLEIGVSFELEDDVEPATLEFATPVGPIQMSKVMFVEDDFVAIAVVFSEKPSPGSTHREPDLWFMQLRWNSPWKQANGIDVSRDMMSDVSEPRSVFDAVEYAVAEKLVRNTTRVTPLQ